MKTSCPYCFHELPITPEHVGKSCRCGFCNKVFTAVVPGTESAPAPSRPSSPQKLPPVPRSIVVEGEMERTGPGRRHEERQDEERGDPLPSWRQRRQGREEAPRRRRRFEEDDDLSDSSLGWSREKMPRPPKLSQGFWIFIGLIIALAVILMLAFAITINNAPRWMFDG